MGNVDRSSEPLRKLRGRAEQKAGRNIQALRKQQPTEKDELLHKLRVHQVELEMQNEELRRARLESETLRQKYFDLFDLAPMGYFTLDRDGRILEANLAGTALLGTTKSQSLKKNLSLWVSRDYQDAFYLHRREAADSKMSCTCELKLRRSDDSEFIAQMVSWAEMDDEGHFEKLRTAVLDISERKRIEEAMRESEARLSEAMKIAKLGYWEYDATDDVFTFDDQFYSVYRTSAEKVGGYRIPARRYAELFLHPDDVPQLREEIQKATETSDPDFCGEGEHRFIYGDGRIGYVSVRYFVVKDSQGRTVKTCGVNQDITERKRAEESLRASENRLSEGAKLAKLGYWEHDVLNELFTFSDHFYEVLRTTADEVGGYEMSCNQYFETFVHPDDRERVKAKCHDVFENPDSQSGHYLEHRIIYADGEIGRIAVRFSRVKDDQGRVIRTYGVNQDITERRRAEEAYRSLVDHSLQGLVIFQEGHVVFANEAMTKITGYTIDEMLAMSPDEVQTFVHPEDREMVWERHAQRLNGNPLSERYELRGIRKDGSVRWLEIDASLVEYQGKRAIQAAYVDITERKQIEEAIKTSEVRYRELFDHMSSGVAVFASRDEGEDFVFLDFNEAGEQIDAIKKEDVIGKSVVDVFPRIREFGLFDVLRNVWKTGVPQHHPVSLYKDERLVGWRENYVYKLPSGEIVAVYRDLTERMRAENALRESEAQLRRAQEVAHMGSWYLDLATDRLTWSDETYRIFEKPVGRPITKEDCQASVHPDDLAHVMESWTKALYAGQYDNEHRIVVGEIVKWVREKAEIEFDRDGEPVSAIGTVQDITERVVAEQERLAHVRFLESMARIDRAIRGTNRLEEMMSNVLGEVLDILECDRAFFVYPCDPDSPTWSVPMERTRPQHPGIAPSTKMRTEDETAEVMRILLAADGPVKFGPGSEHLLASRTAEQFGQQSMIGMALYPKTGGPWAFGLHQCSYPRVWTTEEERLFQQIGGRLQGALTSLLIFRELEENEERLQAALDAGELGIWDWDMVTGRLVWDGHHERIFGFGPGEFDGRLETFESRVHPEDIEGLRKAIEDSSREHVAYAHEYRVLRPDRTTRWVVAIGHCHWDEQGKPIRMLGVITDITDRKRAEAAMRESEQKYRELFENAREAIVILDMDGRVTDANKFVEGYGFSREDLIGRNHFDFVVEEYKEKATEDFEKLRRGIPQEGEYEVITPKGNVAVYYRDNPIVRAGNTIGVQAVLMDITERKRAEDELRKYQAKLKAMASEILQTQERERGRLAVGLHDNVCQNLVLAKLTLESALRSISDTKLAASLGTAADIMGEAINQAESLTFELSNPVLDAFGFVAALDKHLKEEIRKKHGIAVEFKVEEQVDPLEDDIRACLFRVTRELLNNVVKHAKAHKVVVGVGRRGDNICITLRDDGAGFKAAEDTRKSSDTVRFGLFSVREQLEHLGGRLIIESEPGQGTVATVIV